LAIMVLEFAATDYDDSVRFVANELRPDLAMDFELALCRRMSPAMARSILMQGATRGEMSHWLHVISALPDGCNEKHNQGRVPSPKDDYDRCAFVLFAALDFHYNALKAAPVIADRLRPNADYRYAQALWCLMSPQHARRILELGDPPPGVAQRLQKIVELDDVNN
jgi:hypothetical protein